MTAANRVSGFRLATAALSASRRVTASTGSSGRPAASFAAAQYLIPLGFLGFVLCIVRWKTRSLYPCMALHSVNNSIALGYNELHWNGGEILGLVAGSVAVIAAVTLPLASRSPAPAT